MKEGYAELLAIAILLVAAWGLYHMGYTTGKAESTVSLNQEQDANVASQGAITSLKMSLAQCEANNTVDLVAQTKALAERETQAKNAEQTYKDAVLSLSGTMAGKCKDWAKQPACGSVVP